jgi:hypothetical protein
MPAPEPVKEERRGNCKLPAVLKVVVVVLGCRPTPKSGSDTDPSLSSIETYPPAAPLLAHRLPPHTPLELGLLYKSHTLEVIDALNLHPPSLSELMILPIPRCASLKVSSSAIALNLVCPVDHYLVATRRKIDQHPTILSVTGGPLGHSWLLCAPNISRKKITIKAYKVTKYPIYVFIILQNYYTPSIHKMMSQL